MSWAAPKSRAVIVGGRQMKELIRGVLESRLGAVASVIDTGPILESLLEEYFYGGSFQDQFYETLTSMRIPTDLITYLRKEILASIADQINMALGYIRPCNLYSFQLDEQGDLVITETPSRPTFQAPRLAVG